MDQARQRHLDEMKRLSSVIKSTKSPYIKRDYEKALKKMQKQLREYDYNKRQVVVCEGH